jgi:hypothetical protein
MIRYRYIDIRNILFHKIICLWVSFVIVYYEWFWFSKDIVDNYFAYDFAIVGVCFAIYSLTIPNLINLKNKKNLPAKPFKIIFNEMKISKYKLFICFSIGFIMTFILKYFENCNFNKFYFTISFSILLATLTVSFEILFDTAKSIFLIAELDAEDSIKNE